VIVTADAPDPDPDPDPDPESVGLPVGIRACLFDLDGVLTDTASVHSAAWTEMFDAFLSGPGCPDGANCQPFTESDYERYVDGKPRLDGTRTFLQSRQIELPDGQPDDTSGTATVHGLSNAKNNLVLQKIKKDGVETFPGSVAYARAVGAAGLHRAVVSSSANTRNVLAVTGITDLFEIVVDGITAREQHLAGKPAPDTFLAAAKQLGVPPAEAAVFEDALSGVAAGRAGRFGRVIGVERHRSDAGRAELRSHGADVVVRDLSELLGPAETPGR
jgi:beta-phosphoglucomutase family hydrolase